jgi:hypothetical protein
VAYLTGLNGLEWLYLDSNPITDEGMRHLGVINSLKALHLGDTNVTDAGLVHLKGLKHLEHLDVRYTQVTAEGLAELRRAFPELSVVVESPRLGLPSDRAGGRPGQNRAANSRRD